VTTYTVVVRQEAAPYVILVEDTPPSPGSGAVDSVNGQTGDVVLDAADVGAQPADSDLAAIAALSTTAFGRGLLEVVDAAALRVAAALGTAATQPSTAFDAAGSAAAAQAAAEAYADTGDATEAAARANAIANEATARNAAIAAAVANLINSAPGALDTLNELATALGDDPAFATTVTNALAGKQPLDSDLTAIAALTTTLFGRGLLELADAAALRSAAALGTAATQNTSAFDAAGAAAAAQAASQPLDSDLTAIAAVSTTAFGRGLLALADASAMRTAAALGTAATQNTGAFDAAGAASAAQSAAQAYADTLVDDLSGVTSAKAARANLHVERATIVSDADYPVAADVFVVFYGTLTASRAVALPAASSINAGESVVVADASGNCSTSKTITINRAGADTIDGGTSDTLNVSYQLRRYISDGVSKWTVDRSTFQAVAGAGITLTNDTAAKTTTFTSKGVNYQEFATAGTFTAGNGWQKPANALAVLAEVISAGDGGGGGRTGAAGTARYGGGGGGAGTRKRAWLDPADLASQETVTVGAPGTGGAGGGTGGANGTNGGVGGASSFGSHLTAQKSAALAFIGNAAGGLASATTGGYGHDDGEIHTTFSGSILCGNRGGDAAIANAGAGGSSGAGLPGGGGGGGGLDTSNVRRDGGAGGAGDPAAVTAGTAGSGSGSAGGNGADASTKHGMGAGGGAGAASSSSATNGGAGGTGGKPGGGGGGGGASVSGGTASGGRGGDGGAGRVRVWTFVGSGA
jgi:hypothetical protein